MLKQNFLILLCLGTPLISFGFDPLSVTFATSAAQNFMSQMDEATDTSLSFLELMDDLGSNTENSQSELTMATQKLEHLNSEAKELQFANDDIKDSLAFNNSQNQNLLSRIKSLQRSIRATKKIAELFGLKQKTSEKPIRLQEIKLSTMTLEELQSIRRAQYLSYLETEEAKLKREIYLQKILETEKISQKSRSKGG